MPKPARKTPRTSLSNARTASKTRMAGKSTRSSKSRSRTATAAPSRPWSPADERALRRLSGNTPRVQIARVLKRSPGAVTFKAFTMGVSLRLKGMRRGRPSSRLRKAR